MTNGFHFEMVVDLPGCQAIDPLTIAMPFRGDSNKLLDTIHSFNGYSVSARRSGIEDRSLKGGAGSATPAIGIHLIHRKSFPDRLQTVAAQIYALSEVPCWNVEEDMVIEDRPGSARGTDCGAPAVNCQESSMYCIAMKSSCQETGTASILGLETVRQTPNED